MDAIDAALVNIDDDVEVIAYEQFPIEPDLQTTLRAVNSDISISDASELDYKLGEMFANAVHQILKSSHVSEGEVVAIGNHGQTILHLPNSKYPRTIQLGDPNIIALRTGITTVSDFRRADMAAGGQGAPLAPIFHNWKFRSVDVERIVLNLGGMANITVLPADPDANITGFDSGPGNALLDAWIQKHKASEYDDDGEWALSGTANHQLLERFLADDYFILAPPKSTGKDDFNLDWVEKNLTDIETEITPQDVQASLLKLTITSIANAIENFAPSTTEVLVCGGGIHNKALLNGLKEQNHNRTITTTEDYGIHPDAVEAVTFAWLAHLRLTGEPGNILSVTGANKAVLLGGIYQA